MTDTTIEQKWFYRITLLILISALEPAVLQSQSNFTNWIPHNFLRQVGFSYNNLL